MRTISAPALAVLAGPIAPLAQLVYFALSTPVRLNTTGWDLTSGGFTWQAAPGIGRIDMIEDSPGEVRGLRFELNAVDASYIAIALAEPLQGKVAEIYTAIFDPATYQIIESHLEWAGCLDVMPIVEDGNNATIAVTAEHAGIDLIRPRVLKYSAQDQKRIDPADLGFEFVIDQSDKPIVWPSAKWGRQ